MYGQTLTVEFVARLRSERRFNTREALTEQLRQDREKTLSCLKVKS